jgi:hypothetical protein
VSETSASTEVDSGPSSTEPATRDRVPIWLAIAITVVVSLPFGLWLGDYNLPLWVSFIVWAEYFVLGARPSALKVMIPAFFVGVVGAAGITTFTAVLEQILDSAGIVAQDDVAAYVGMFVGFCVFLYLLRFVPLDLFGSASLPHFNGVSMMLGVFFTGAWLSAAPEGMSPLLEPALAAVGAMLAGLLGCFLGWFNVTILFRVPSE